MMTMLLFDAHVDLLSDKCLKGIKALSELESSHMIPTLFQYPPYVLNPIPYTLYPVPYTLHPTSSTLYP